MLEAMACVILVLATPTGTIPDVIIDSKAGFIIENNSPGLEQIAENRTQSGRITLCSQARTDGGREYLNRK